MVCEPGAREAHRGATFTVAQIIELESSVTASFASAPAEPRRPSALGAIVVGFVGAAAFLGLIVAGLTFFALAIAFPIAVPLAISYHVPVSAHDAALAQQFAGAAWLFIGLAVAAFGASIAVLVLMVKTISPAPRD